MNIDRTIAAISTPPGVGGIGIVRISGKDAKPIADRIFAAKNGKKICNASGYTALYGHIVWEEETIDEAIALVFNSPASYTGEDVVELSCHGGSYIMKSVLRAALGAGASLAEPGEFTKQAFLNHKLDLTQAEAVMQLISAEGEEQRRAAMSVRDGAVSKKIATIREFLLNTAGNLAAYTDYPDEDIPELDPVIFGENIRDAGGMLRALLKDYDAGKILREGIDTAIVGRPNVGKSTLMNLLVGEQRSIVCDIAGTTRDVVEESVMLGAVRLRLCDTAGLRSTDDPIEAIGVDLAKDKMNNAQLILAVLDASTPLNEHDRALLEICKSRTALVIVNKSDLAPAWDVSQIEEYGIPMVVISAADENSFDILKTAVEKITGVSHLDPQSGFLASERQRDHARAALAAIDEAESTLAAGFTLDAVGVCLDDALEQLLSLTGERVSNAVADNVFSRFCVGK